MLRLKYFKDVCFKSPLDNSIAPSSSILFHPIYYENIRNLIEDLEEYYF